VRGKLCAAKMETQLECQEKIVNERQHFWEKALRSKAMVDAKLESERRGFEALIEHMAQTHLREMNRMNNIFDDKEMDMMKLTERHEEGMGKLQSELDNQKELVHEEAHGAESY